MTLQTNQPECTGGEYARSYSDLSLLAAAGTNSYDALTGLLDHRAFLDTLERARGQCRRRHTPLAVLLIDLTNFRQINRDHSPATGDHVLTRVGNSLMRLCRAGDIVCRYSWDGFAIALPESTEEHACELAARCREVLGRGALAQDEKTPTVDTCIGVTETTPGFVETIHDVLDRAEHALSTAKHGKDQPIVRYSTIERTVPSRRLLTGAAVDDVARWIGATRQQLRLAYLGSTRVLVGAVEAKDPYTRQHSLRVSDHAESLGRRLGMTAAQLETLKTAAILHDVGKIGVPDAILQKPGPLTAEEFDIVKQHPEISAQIVGHASFLSAELPIILHHHERFDGKGYPSGLAGDQIPFGARVLAVADSLDAMSSRRSYKPGFTTEQILAELRKCAGKQWDPAVTAVAIDWLQSEPLALHNDN